MEKYYFTFGSDEGFPFQNTYIVIIASSYRDAVNYFQSKYPNRASHCMNCSDCYNEKEWENTRKYYKSIAPEKIFWTETCYGKRPEGYDDIYIFVPEKKEIIRISEGTGDLLPEDKEEEYIDYVDYEQYRFEDGIKKKNSRRGRRVLLKEPFQEKFCCTAECIPEVLYGAYGNYFVNCMILT